MKVISLYAENIKKLIAVEIRPTGALVEVQGKNGAGKSSVLDSLYWALCGKGVIQTKPIREGQERAVIKLDIGEFIITRTFKTVARGNYTTDIRVEAADGRVMKKPQDVLDGLAGELSYDPLQFLHMKPKEQFDALRAFVPQIDFAAVEKDNKADYEERTLTNRRKDQAKVEARAIRLPEGTIPSADDLPALEAQLSTAMTHNSEIEGRKVRRESAEQSIKDINLQMRDLIAKREEIQKKLDEAGPLPDPIDIASIQAKLSAARSNSQVAQDAEKKKRLDKEVRDLEKKSEDLSKAIKDRAASVAKLVREANIPVPGLAFAEGEVTLNGQPFAQASDAEQLRASIAIAGALSPELRIVRVRDGSLLDSAGLEALREYAEKHDLQIWLEKIADDARSGFVIEDGELKDFAAAEAADSSLPI